MSIAPHVAEAIVREHKFRPIEGDVLLLGRQTMLFSPDYAAALIKAYELAPAPLPADESIIDRRTKNAKGGAYIRDDAFFRMLGVPKVRALDHSDYEGAEIIHDLNRPVPDHLEATADFILDGSTLDNLFSPSTALQSVARMLRPGGRFLSVNLGSFHMNPYTVMSPYWYMDFFSVNRFADCHVYIFTHGRRGSRNVYRANPTSRSGAAFMPILVTGIGVFAEKAAHSTWNEIPSQRYYSAADEIDARVADGRRFQASGRPELYYSKQPKPFGFLETLTNTMRAENRTVEDFKMVVGNGVEVNVPISLALRLARKFRFLAEE